MTLGVLDGLIAGCSSALDELAARIDKLKKNIEVILGISSCISNGMTEMESASAACEKRLMSATQGRAPLNPAKKFLGDTLEAYRGSGYRTAYSSMESAADAASGKKTEMEDSVEELEHERGTVAEQMRSYQAQAQTLMMEGKQ